MRLNKDWKSSVEVMDRTGAHQCMPLANNNLGFELIRLIAS